MQADDATAQWLAANRAAIHAMHDAKARAAARKTLDATLARMHAQRPAPAPRGDPRAAAARELAVPGRYDLATSSGEPLEKSPWERFWEWLGDLWNRFWNATAGRVHIGAGGQQLLGSSLLAAAGAALVFALVRLLVNLQIDPTRRRGVSHPLEAGRNAHALYLRALALAQAGDYAGAARTLFLAAVTALDLRGVMRDDASATVGEMRRRLRARDVAMVAPFEDVAAPFVAAAYAERDVAAGEWERAVAGYQTLVRMEKPA